MNSDPSGALGSWWIVFRWHRWAFGFYLNGRPVRWIDPTIGFGLLIGNDWK